MAQQMYQGKTDKQILGEVQAKKVILRQGKTHSLTLTSLSGRLLVNQTLCWEPREVTWEFCRCEKHAMTCL